MYDVSVLASWPTHEEIIGFDVAIDQVLLVDRLHSIEHLLGYHHNGLDGELPATYIKQVFEAWPQEVNHKDIVQPFLSEMVYLGNTNCQSHQKRSEKRVCCGYLIGSVPQPDNIL